ncbi:BQ5605_C007g04532 [Microbotryum silenes-dioicae]|uniref:BQ5605_C007g04532 protein n=1 Tax=Microbotryum silenes-dioicae TaxID=796604 RepID=A0A2X0P9N6_9BASI|nr:BQ5605_C007g04532 [Microbotryum silenes-dioicae]
MSISVDAPPPRQSLSQALTDNPSSTSHPHALPTSSTTAPSSCSNTNPTPSSEDDPFPQAAKLIDDRLLRDEQWVPVGDRLGFGASYDYVPRPHPAWSPFVKRRTVALPDRLFDEYTSTAHCTMGLSTEIERAWVTIDHRLLLWDWADGSSFTTFDQLDDIIIAVALVKPRPNVFVDAISYLLVLATSTQITLVGLGYAPTETSATPEITFYLTGLSVSSEALPFTHIQGTSTGRIFLSTSPEAVLPNGRPGDGALYELVYQSSEGWFVKRCSLHNLTSGSITQSLVPSFLRNLAAVSPNEWIISFQLDNERGLLYTLLRNGTIEMYELPSSSPSARFDGPPNKLARTGDVLRAARELCKSPALEGTSFRIVALQIIALQESEKDKVALVAITNTGVRLYFTHQRRYPSYAQSSIRALELFHVRPPPFIPTQTAHAPQPPTSTFYSAPPTQQQQPPPLPSQPLASASSDPSEFTFKAINQANYASGGLLVAANNRSEEIGVLFLAAPDNAAASQQANLSGPSSSSSTTMTSMSHNGPGALTTTTGQQTFSEIASTIEIGGQTWEMAEIQDRSANSGLVPGGKTALNELATQVALPRREWVVLTDMGANVIARQRPIDTLVDLLEGASGLVESQAHGDVAIFFTAFGLNQSCAMLLAIAAGNSRLTRTVSDSTSPSTHLNGGSTYVSNSRNPTSAVENAKALFFEHGGRPVAVDRGGFGSQQLSSNASSGGGQVIFSGKHEGLAFYLARLLRPIWSAKVTRTLPGASSPAGSSPRQVSNVPESVLTQVQRDLVSLRTFIEAESRLFALPSNLTQATHLTYAYQTEQTSLEALRSLLVRSVEAISFVLLLIDYQISDLVVMCDQDTQKMLLGLSWQDLLTKKVGRDVARKLVSAIINQQIGRQLSVDAISETLQQRCGSFCSADDVLLYKAIEATRRAKDTSDPSERTDCLRESLRLFIKASKQLSFERASEVCHEYIELRYYLGAIELAVACAHEWDPTDRALSFAFEGEPANDPRKAIFDLRQKCNQLVFKTLSSTDDLLNEAMNSNNPGGVSYAEADSLRSNAYDKVLSIKDQFLHFELYAWYLSQGRTDALLEARTPYLEAYLAQEPTTLEKTDLLWRFYARTSRYDLAAGVLAHLAETTHFPLSIYKRVEYLSLAVANAKSQFPSTHAQAVQFLTDVEEKLEVAQVQIEIYRAIEGLDSEEMTEEERRQWLDRVEDRLFTISELYSEFAEPLRLLEIVLLIFHVSDHRDPYLVAATWEAILAKSKLAGPAREDVADPDQAVDLLTVKITELGRRFHSSDVAFPLPALATMFERFSYDNKLASRAGWVPLAFRDAGVPPSTIFATYDELISAKVPPWHTSQGLLFLITSATVFLENWLQETTHNPVGSTSMRRDTITDDCFLFPAAEVTTAVGKWLMGLGSVASAKDVVARLNEVQREIRRRF